MKLDEVLDRVRAFRQAGPPSCQRCGEQAPVEFRADMGGEEGDELVISWRGNMIGWCECHGKSKSYHLCPKCRK